MSDYTPTATELRQVYHKGDISDSGNYGESAANPLLFAPWLYDKDYDVVTSFNFTLRVEGAIDVPVKTIRGINKNNEYEYIQEGGLNDYVHMVRKQVSQPFQFQVERYVSQDIFEDFVDPLANGTEFILPLVLYLYRGSLGSNLAPVRFYVFNNARVTGVQIGDLDAEKSALHTVTTTIAYSQLLTITLPEGAVDFTSIYKFNKDNVPNREVVNARTLEDLGLVRTEPAAEDLTADPPITEVDRLKENDQRVRTKEDMKKLAEAGKYNFQGRTKGGKDPIPAPTKNLREPEIKQPSKKDMEQKSGKYAFQGRAKGGKDPIPAPTDKVKLPEGQLSKVDMMEKAKKYEHDAELPNPSDRVVQPEGQLSMMEMEALADRYVFDNKSTKSTDHVKTPDGQTSKKVMEVNAQKYRYNAPASDKVVQPKSQKSKADMRGSASKYKYNDPISDNVKGPEGQLSKDEMENNAAGFRFGDNASDNVVKPNGQLSKASMQRKNHLFKYGDEPSTHVKQPEAQDTREGFEGNASKYEYGSDASGNVKIPEGQSKKKDFIENASKYEYGSDASGNVKVPEGQSKKKDFIENASKYEYGSDASGNVKVPEGQVKKKDFEGKAKKYPATRSARQVEEFLGKK